MIYGSIDTLTGGYLYDKQVVDHLSGRGHRVEILSLPVRRYPFRFVDNLGDALIRRVAGAGYGLLLQDELCHPSLFLFNRRLRRRASVPIVAVVHHLLCHEPRSGMLNALLALPEARYLDSVDGFIFNSRSTQQVVYQLSPVQRPYVIARPGGDRFRGRVSAERIAARAHESGPLRLLFVGLVIERKGLLPLVRALGGADRDRWRLEVVGDTTVSPDYVRRVQREIEDQGLAANVRFSGTQSTEALAERFTGSHLLCMPFAYEGFGIVTLEALNFGLPVLGCADGATPELIRHGQNGLLFDRDDLRAVTTAVQGLHANRSRLQWMSAAAYESARGHPTWRDSLQRIELFLEQFQRTIGGP
jgi:glycosyltransferase involved in cell wall biosynthesis